VVGTKKRPRSNQETETPAARGVRGYACLLTSTAPYKDGLPFAKPIIFAKGN
jgi:hypothetical protein